MQVNASKCHVLISADQKVHVNICTTWIENSKSEKYLGVHIGCRLNLDKHIKIICSKP